MKTRFFFFSLAMLISASSFAAKYRVFSIRGISKVKTPTGAIQTLSIVNQTFECNNPRLDIKPFSSGATIQVVEARPGAAQITQIANCAPTPCITTANIVGSRRKDWDNFALNGGDFVLTQSLSHDLSAFVAVNQQQIIQSNSKIQSTQIQKTHDPIRQVPNNTKVLDKAVLKNRQ